MDGAAVAGDQRRDVVPGEAAGPGRSGSGGRLPPPGRAARDGPGDGDRARRYRRPRAVHPQRRPPPLLPAGLRVDRPARRMADRRPATGPGADVVRPDHDLQPLPPLLRRAGGPIPRGGVRGHAGAGGGRLAGARRPLVPDDRTGADGDGDDGRSRPARRTVRLAGRRGDDRGVPRRGAGPARRRAVRRRRRPDRSHPGPPATRAPAGAAAGHAPGTAGGAGFRARQRRGAHRQAGEARHPAGTPSRALVTPRRRRGAAHERPPGRPRQRWAAASRSVS